MIKVEFKNYQEEFLVGYICSEDDSGVLLYNVNFCGIGTGWEYIPKSEIINIDCESTYLKKIQTLFEMKEQNIEKIDRIETADLKQNLMKWIQKNNKRARITIDGEDIISEILSVTKEKVKIHKIDHILNTYDGYAILMLENIEYVGEYNFD